LEEFGGVGLGGEVREDEMRQMVNDAGQILIKRVIVKIFYPHNKKSSVRNYFTKGKHTGVNDQQVSEVLDECGEFVSKKWPNHEYRLVELGPGRFNFVWECEKEKA
jgi:hypothetical protein